MVLEVGRKFFFRVVVRVFVSWLVFIVVQQQQYSQQYERGVRLVEIGVAVIVVQEVVFLQFLRRDRRRGVRGSGIRRQEGVEVFYFVRIWSLFFYSYSIQFLWLFLFFRFDFSWGLVCWVFVLEGLRYYFERELYFFLIFSDVFVKLYGLQ